MLARVSLGARLRFDPVATGSYATHQAGSHVYAGGDADTITGLHAAGTGENTVRPNLALEGLRWHLGKYGNNPWKRDPRQDYRE